MAFGRAVMAIAAFALAVPATTPAVARDARGEAGLAVIPLTLTARKKPRRYQVEVARTPEEQARGMMYRTRMADGAGMLFPMQPARSAAFWMENTFIPLDLVFIGPDRRVLNIAANARPMSREMIPSAGPIIAVLELAGGEAERIGLKPGDPVSW